MLVQLEDGGDVSAAVTIVRSGPDGHDGVVEHELVALHDKLVSPGDQIQAVGGVELWKGGGGSAQEQKEKKKRNYALHNISAEKEPGTSWAQTPTVDF